MSDEPADRRARLRAQTDQAVAEGVAMTEDDPAFLDALCTWQEATIAAARALLAKGVPPEALMGAMLAPTADVVAQIRDEHG